MAVLVAAGAAEASAQEVTARIAGLEGNAEYMEMLREEASLQAREDSVTMVVNRVRRQLRDDPAQRAVYSAEILRCEERSFRSASNGGRLTDRINTVEQDWVLANLDLSSPSTTTAGRAAGTPLPDSLQTADLVHNAYFREQLPQADYRALLSAQRRERTAFDLAAACAANYEAIEELKISYDTITAETPAAVLYERYRTLQSLNRSLCDSLQRVWGAVYDNKNYAYAYVLDRLGRDDLLAKTEEQRLAGVRQQMASERGRYYADELTDYLLQKRALVDVETELAGALGLTAARDSLARAAAGLRIVDYRLPKLFIEERMFLEYEPIRVRHAGQIQRLAPHSGGKGLRAWNDLPDSARHLYEPHQRRLPLQGRLSARIRKGRGEIRLLCRRVPYARRSACGAGADEEEGIPSS